MKSILIIEDEVSLLNALKEHFEEENFTVYQASNGEEGIKEALGKHPDVILLDIIMPVMDGAKMLNKLRGDAWGKKAKVIILTNLSDSVKEKELVKQGACGYMVKSNFTLDDIVKKVNKELSKA